jgi:transcriptional regulator with XRE-family HTH domain
MMNIGKVLREERERLGLSLDDIAEKTLIRQYYLEEIEEGKFPAYDGYTAAYIRKYAETVSLDPQPLVDEYRGLFKGKETALKPRKNKSIYPYVVVVVIVALIGLFFFKAYSNRVKAPIINPSQAVETPSTPSQVTPSEPTPTQPVEETGVHLILKGTGLCWLGVTVDGKYSQMYIHAGETLEFKGKNSITIRYGFAPYVSVNKNGKDLGVVSTKDKVVEVTYNP